ncbi:MAG: maleylpyruvate isomerase family mycothiol-dependent enzyme [Nitriliruptorales bacterium]|nr:maleylpyruvate isomerase family mycothiol-dependent enzyme [Nitriliruptorales bacterium]
MTRSGTGDKLERLLGAHRDLYTSLLHLCEELAPQDWDLSTGCPGWSVRDVVAHVVGVESVLAGDPEPDIDLPDDLPHVKNEFAQYMERHVAARSQLSVADLLLEARDVFSRRLGQVEAVADLETELTGPMGSSAPAYRMLPLRVFDMWAHEQDIRRATGRTGHLDGPAVDVSVDRIAKGLAVTLGRSEGLSGTTVIEVTGERETTIGIDLEHGALADVTAPDVRLSMPFADFVARVCGRSDAPGVDLVLIEGDRELADAVLSRFAITP